MTDSNATERLRALLDEHGVEYEADDHKNYAYTYWGDWAYCESLDAKPGTLGAQCELMLIPATPEQAIAATLGSEREKALESLVKQLWYLVNHRSGYGYAAALEAIEELGIEVDE